MQTEEPSAGQNTLFQISDTANVTFQDLMVSFDGISPNSQMGTAFSFSGGAGHKLFRVNVENCQYPVVIDGTVGVAIRHCEFNYGTSFDASIQEATALQILGATQTSIADCLVSDNKESPMKTPTLESVSLNLHLPRSVTRSAPALATVSLSGVERVAARRQLARRLRPCGSRVPAHCPVRR
jgi:hypothetical protein